MIKTASTTFILLSVCTPLLRAETPDSTTVISKIVFGSCIKQDQPAPILETIEGESPQLLILTGDNIYADTEDMDVMQTKYRTLASKPAFLRLRDSCEILATWDDHDFGVNDGGADYPKRIESQQVFLDFWNEPTDSPRRQQQGIYLAKTFGPVGKRLQIILLDTRYHRSPLKTAARRVGGPYVPDDRPGKTMLGQSQWKWLEQKLRQPAEIRLIVSSIQFAAADAGQECWANLPRERERMLNLIRNTSANGVVFVSGDRHWSEISAIRDSVPYPIYDVTCSSLNQLHARGTPTDNAFRVSDNTFHRENYGVLSIQWNRDPKMAFSIRDLQGTPVIEFELRSSEISR